MEILTRDRVLELAAKFLNMTEEKGASPTEAASAAAMLQSLLAKHQLSMFDVETADFKKKNKAVEEDFTSAWKNVPDYAKVLCGAICRSFDVRIIYETSTGRGTRMIFIGQELDAAVAKYLWMRCTDELYELAGRKGKYKGLEKSQLSTFRANFVCAAAVEIEARLKKQREEDSAKYSKYGALIVVKQDLIKDYLEEMYPGLKTIQVKHSFGVGSREGAQAGKEIDLSMRGLDGSTKPVERVKNIR